MTFTDCNYFRVYLLTHTCFGMASEVGQLRQQARMADMSGKVQTTCRSDDIETCPKKKFWNSVSGKYGTGRHLVILFPINVFHFKPDFTLRLKQKYFDRWVCQIDIWTANCEWAAAVIFDWWIIDLSEAVQFLWPEKVKPREPFKQPNPMPNVLPGPDTFFTSRVLFLAVMKIFETLNVFRW